MTKQTIHYPNKDDWQERFWQNRYKVWLTAQGILFHVNADHEQDAIDYVIDYCEEHLPGLLMTREEEQEEEYLDDYISGGNHGVYLNTYNVRIELF